MRIRTLKPEFWEDDKIGALPLLARLMFVGCLNLADDLGVFRANYVIIKSKLFPYDPDIGTEQVKVAVELLTERGFLRELDHQGARYLVIRNFLKHQKLDKRYCKYLVPAPVVEQVLTRGEPTVPPPQEREREVEQDREKEQEVEMEQEVEPEPAPRKGLPAARAATPPSAIDYAGVQHAFNTAFSGRLPAVTVMTRRRREAVRARIAEHGPGSVARVFGRVRASPFLMGSNDRGWQADFDWIFRPNNFIKILEGNYNDNGKQKNGGGSAGRKESVKNLAELARGVLQGIEMPGSG